jgi:subtilisin family serine protease
MSKERDEADSVADASELESARGENAAPVFEEVDETHGGEYPPPIPPPGFTPQPEWLPGVVNVEFGDKFSTKALTKPSPESKADGEEDAWRAELWDVLDEHRLIWSEPSFSAVPQWKQSEPGEDDPPGRDKFYTLHFPSGADVSRIARELQQRSSLVVRAAPVPRLSPPGTPENEPLLGEQWYISRCRADIAWKIEANGKKVSGEGVVVADIDWGFNVDHQDLKPRIALRHNSITGSKDIVMFGPRVDHGTAVLGILGAADNDRGMAGFAFGATLWAIQAGKDPNTSDPKFWVAAIDFVRKKDSGGRRKVICLEVETKGQGNAEMDLTINKAIKDAIASGVVVCVPAGNGGKNVGEDDEGKEFGWAGSIIVGATLFDDDEKINRAAPFSNWGERVTVSAPGAPNRDLTCGVASNNSYRKKFGRTSGAAPKVAGTIALMLEANPQLTHADIRDILRATGTPITGAGSKPIGTFLNAEAAVLEAKKRAVEFAAGEPLPMSTPEHGTDENARL